MAKTLSSFCQEFWQWRMKESPEFATAIGFHSFDDALDDLSQEAMDQRKVYCNDFLKRLSQLSLSDKEEHLTCQLLQEEISDFLAGLPFCSYLYPINMMEGPQIDLMRTFSWMKFQSADDYEKALRRLSAFPKQVDQMVVLMRRGIVEGRVASSVSLAGVDKQFQMISSKQPEDSSFFSPFKSFPEAVPAADRERLALQAISVLHNELLPAYKRLEDFLTQEYIPACRHSIACSDLPSGAAHYAQCLKFHTSTDLSAQQIHNVGLEEVTRIRSEMDQIIKEVGFTGTFKDFLHHLRTNEKFYFKSEAELVKAYQKTCGEIRSKLPSLFRNIPDLPCRVVETPPSSAASAPAAYYLAPSEDGSRPGTFYINTYNLEQRPTYDMVALCLHECEPGHHLQSVFAMQQGEMPGFRRHMEDRVYYQAPGRFAMHTAYMEGWGLYCESLGNEMDMYKDPYMRFGRLSMEILRACRLVVDTGMHALGWTRQQAVDYMTENSAVPLHEVKTEIDRYITWPGQACAYKIGELKIKEYRAMAIKELGDQFDIRDFHEIILSVGAVPLAFLQSAIKEYISQHKPSA